MCVHVCVLHMLVCMQTHSVYGYVSTYMHVFIYVEEEVNLACYSSEAVHLVL